MNSRVIIFIIFFFSGVSGLIYEVVWTRMLVLVFGATALAVSAVLTAFMAGLALGGYSAGRWSAGSKRLLLAYGLFEIGIGIYGLSVPTMFSFLVPIYQVVWERFEPTFYVFSMLRFLLATSVLLAPTVLMGATLPVLSQYFADRREAGAGREIGRLYGINTAGAVLGTFACGVWLLPSLGTSLTIYAAAAINLLLGSAAILVSLGQLSSRKDASGEVSEAVPATHPLGALPVRHGSSSPLQAGIVLIGMTVSGFAALVYEVAWTRVLVLVFGSTVYSFTAMLSTFLMGLAAGALIAAHFVERLRRPVFFFGAVQVLVGIVVFVATSMFGILPDLYVILAGPFADYHGIVMAVKLVMAMLVMLPPTLLMGALFPVAIKICQTSRPSAARTVGDVYAFNTLGAIGGSFVAGFVMIPFMGAQGTVFVGILLNFGVAGAVLLAAPAGRALKAAMLTAAGLGALIVLDFRPSWDPLAMTSGPAVFLKDYAAAVSRGSKGLREMLGERKMLYYEEGLTGTVSVYEVSHGGKRIVGLAVDGKTEASDTKPSMSTQTLLAHLPLLQARAEARVLIIGAGSGVTVGTALQYPVAEVRLVEMEQGVVSASRAFSHVNHRYWEDPRVRIEYNDGRNALLNRRNERYDAIIVQPSDPWVRGASNLFTQDFFRLVRDRLAEDGFYAQWLPGVTLATEHVRTLMATYRSVFETVYVFQPPLSHDFVFVASKKFRKIDEREIRGKMAIGSVSASLGSAGIREPLDVFAILRMGPKELDRFVGGARINTDDNALIEFAAPTLFRVEPEGRIHEQIARLIGPEIPFHYVEAGSRGALDALAKERAARSYRRMGAVAVQDGARPGLAADLFRRAIRLEPSHVGAHIGLGRALVAMGQTIEGLRELRKAIRLGPNDPKAFYEYAVALDLIGALAEAEPYYRRTIILLRGSGGAPGAEAESILKQSMERVRFLEGTRDSG